MQILRNQINTTLSEQWVGVRKGFKLLFFGVEDKMNYMYTLEDCSEDIIFLRLRIHRTGDEIDVKELSDYKYQGSFKEYASNEMIHIYMKEEL